MKIHIINGSSKIEMKIGYALEGINDIWYYVWKQNEKQTQQNNYRNQMYWHIGFYSSYITNIVLHHARSTFHRSCLL